MYFLSMTEKMTEGCRIRKKKCEIYLLWSATRMEEPSGGYNHGSNPWNTSRAAAKKKAL